MGLRNYLALLFVMLGFILTFTHSKYRIVGSGYMDIIDVPYVVSIRYDNRNQCVGSLVNKKKVVTAASCMDDPNLSLYTVIAGADNLYRIIEQLPHDGQVQHVECVTKHPDYDSDTKNFNIAVVTVCGLFNLDSKVQPIKFGSCTFESPTEMKVNGWGWTWAEFESTTIVLKYAYLTSIGHDDCMQRYQAAGITLGSEVICAGHVRRHDLCNEDSGAPGVVNGELCAVASHYLGCGNPNFPSVFTVVNNRAVITFLRRATVIIAPEQNRFDR